MSSVNNVVTTYLSSMYVYKRGCPTKNKPPQKQAFLLNYCSANTSNIIYFRYFFQILHFWKTVKLFSNEHLPKVQFRLLNEFKARSDQWVSPSSFFKMMSSMSFSPQPEFFARSLKRRLQSLAPGKATSTITKY